MADPQRLAVPQRHQGLSPALLGRIEAGAEAVDRGVRSLAPEVAELGASGVLASVAGTDAPGGRWRAAGADPALYAQLWQLGRASLPLARLFEGHVDALGLIWRLGSEEARLEALRVATAGGLLGVWGADQPGNAVIAAPDGTGGVVLQGGKAFASGLGLVRLAAVTARDAAGLCQLLLLPADDATRHDVQAWDMDGMVGSASGWIDLDGMMVPASYKLGAPGALFAEPHFHGGLWRIAAVQAGALDGLAHALLACLRERRQDQDPVQRKRLAQLVLEAATADHWARAAAKGIAAPGAHDGAHDGAIECALFAREAVEQAAGRGLDHAERAAGTAMHARAGALSRIARDLRLYLRQASLDAKLDHAVGLWLGRSGHGVGI